MKENYVEIDSLHYEIDNQELSGNSASSLRTAIRMTNQDRCGRAVLCRCPLWIE
ncbi:lantibiotic salivaricin M precursor [Streptococcus marmotae]|uniref:lantibiotic salivaricin M precursor n=1 Tax=Streptococcus marmotae TaxID=1825069 RepID=UPI000A6C789C|nr:lantibiotic salivaricin M precursor [Streptococcus marmotae]